MNQPTRIQGRTSTPETAAQVFEPERGAADQIDDFGRLSRGARDRCDTGTDAKIQVEGRDQRGGQ